MSNYIEHVPTKQDDKDARELIHAPHIHTYTHAMCEVVEKRTGKKIICLGGTPVMTIEKYVEDWCYTEESRLRRDSAPKL